MNQIWQSIASDGNTQWVLWSTLLLGIASGILGSFALLKKQSLVGDAVAHASLPGICLAFMVIGEKNFFLLLVGAAATGLLAAYTIQLISGTTRIKKDTSIGLVLSVFFGAGIVLLTKVAQMPSGNQSGLNDFIFGQAASLVGRDVQMMAITAAAVILVVLLLFKELKISTFDADFARGIGLPVKGLNFLFMSLLVLTIVIGIQAVGVILMAALLITPAVSARYWTDSLTKMVIISSFFGGMSGMIGTLISTLGKGLSTGPFIVLSATFFFAVSVLFSPHRGIVSTLLRRKQNDRRLAFKWIMKELYNQPEPLSRNNLFLQSHFSNGQCKAVLKDLLEKGYIQEKERIELTVAGKEKAYQYKLVDEILELKDMYPNDMAFDHLEWLEYGQAEQISREQLVEIDEKITAFHDQFVLPSFTSAYEGGNKS
ncbi:metal ABC transporter permease [Domibacillus indicus]|uniref:metal ABC transporter permease n=1 Tax=Domibacillus indicus TaxID=1437523 RepID=UPI000617C4A7|nr:metal ABC transporter permease [Domibacillus indicus]